MTNGGSIPPDTAPVMDITAASPSAGGGKSGGGGGGSSGTTLMTPACGISLLVPPPAWADNRDVIDGGSASSLSTVTSSGALNGRGSLLGLIHGIAYVSKRETFGKAIAELKVRSYSEMCALSLITHHSLVSNNYPPI